MNLAPMTYALLAQVSALVATFTISTAQTATHGANIDDILAVARNFVSKESKTLE